MASGSLGPPDAAEKRDKPRIQIHLPSILKGGFRFVVFALPLKKQRDVDEEMEKLLKFAMRWIRIRRVYLDCKFYQVEVVRLLKRLGVKFIIRARIRGKLDDRAKRAKPPTVFKYTVRSKKGEEEANMVVVRGRGESCVF